MNDESRKMRKCLWGLDETQADRKIANKREAYTTKLEEMKHTIDILRIDNYNLNRSIDNLKKELENEVKSKDFVEFALKKTAGYISLIDNAAIIEIEEIKTVGEKTETIFDRKIYEFNEMIRKTQESLNLLLRSVLDSNEDLGDKLIRFTEERDSCNASHKESLDYNNSYIQLSKKIKSKKVLGDNPIGSDVSSIKNKYLIGKMAVEDFLDKNGDIIISEKTIITNEIIDRAQIEGKLPELIVNMNLPDS